MPNEGGSFREQKTPLADQGINGGLPGGEYPVEIECRNQASRHETEECRAPRVIAPLHSELKAVVILENDHDGCSS
jgi:hypothetical protein